MDWSTISAADFANGVLFIIGAVIAALGGLFGLKQKRKDAGDEPLELAGAVIDQKQAETIVATAGANTEALEENTEALEKNTEAIEQSRRETVHALESLNREVQNLRQEIIVFRREA